MKVDTLDKYKDHIRGMVENYIVDINEKCQEEETAAAQQPTAVEEGGQSRPKKKKDYLMDLIDDEPG